MGLKMQDLLTQQETYLFEPHAWQIVFRDKLGESEFEPIVIEEPRNLYAVLTPLDVTYALSNEYSPSDDSIDIVWIPPGIDEKSTIGTRAEEWVRRDLGAVRYDPILAGIRTVRVFWHDNRVLIYADAEKMHDTLDAVVRFSVLEREMRALETTMAAMWPTIDADKALTHSVTNAQQSRQPHVNEMTKAATQMKTRFLRAKAAVKQFDPKLSGSSKRLYAELADAAAVNERLELLDEPIQFALDHYEVANTRLIDERYAVSARSSALVGNALEAAIVLILISELIALLYQIRLFL